MNNLKNGTFVIKDMAKTLSTKAGVYRMLDKDEKVLYVGKVKNLTNRVMQYTNIAKHSIRIQRMISRTAKMEVVETASESQALLLEADLIKTLHPYYNILLRDDKSYPEIELSVVAGIAKIKKHRGVHKKGCRYFGPFVSARAVNQTISILGNVFHLSNSVDSDKKKSSYKQRYLPVLKHKFMRVFAPDGGRFDHKLDSSYESYINEVLNFLSGKDMGLTSRLNDKMITASVNEDFELAGVYRDRLKALNSLQISQGMMINGIGDCDVIALEKSGGVVCIQILFYRNSIASGSAVFFPRIDDDDNAIILAEFIPQFYSDMEVSLNVPKTIYCSDEVLDSDIIESTLGTRIHVPKGGFGKTVMERAIDNAKSALSRHKSSLLNHTQALEELMEI